MLGQDGLNQRFIGVLAAKETLLDTQALHTCSTQCISFTGTLLNPNHSHKLIRNACTMVSMPNQVSISLLCLEAPHKTNLINPQLAQLSPQSIFYHHGQSFLSFSAPSQVQFSCILCLLYWL